MITKHIARPESSQRRAFLDRSAKQGARHVDWSLLSAQGRILFYIAFCPRCSVQEIAAALGQTERAVWGIIRDLRRRNMITRRGNGRRHRYSINLDAPLLHPTIHGLTLRPILGRIAEQGEREANPACVRIE